MAFDAASGRRIVLTAPLTEMIDHAGYFIQMSMASLPIWLEGILNRKYPKWRDVEYNEDGSARYMPAGVRVLEASPAARLPGRGRGLLLSGGPPPVHRPADAGRGGLHAQSAGRHVCRRCLHVDLRHLAGADQRPLRAGTVRAAEGEPAPRTLPGDRRRVGRLADHPDRHWQELGVDCVVEGRSESTRRSSCSSRPSAESRCRARSTSHIRRPATRSCSPTSARRSAWSR